MKKVSTGCGACGSGSECKNDSICSTQSDKKQEVVITSNSTVEQKETSDLSELIKSIILKEMSKLDK